MREQQDKPTALHHVLYEIDMLAHALKVLRCPNVAKDWRLHSGWIEVFAIHTRNLNDFFSRGISKKQYMKPSDFVPWTCSHVVDSKITTRLNNQIAHLTYAREHPDQKTPWPTDQVFNPLREQSLTFLKAVLSVKQLLAGEGNKAWAEALIVSLKLMK